MRKKNLVLVLLPLVLILGWAAIHLAGGPARAADATSTGSTITVNGSGTVEVAPDQAMVTIGAEEDAATAVQAQAALANDTTAMEKTILAAGIEKKDITTSGYDLSPAYDDHGKITGYRVSSYFTVAVNKLDSLGAFLDAMVAAGSNRIISIQFQRTDIATYKEEALQKAVSDAQAKAVAAQLGLPLGPVTKVTESSPNIGPVYQYGASLSGAAQGPATAVEPGRMTITAAVMLENSN